MEFIPSLTPSVSAAHSRKRTAAQRAADLLFIETHAVKGKTQIEIAALLAEVRPYRISRAQIAYDIDELKRRWIETGVESYSLGRARALKKLDAVEGEAWESWEKSKADGPGNPTFAKVILEVHDRRVKLLGLDAPVRTEISGPEGAPIAIETREGQLPLDSAAKQALFTRYMALIAKDTQQAPPTSCEAEAGPN
jgi:hypothetical protein